MLLLCYTNNSPVALNNVPIPVDDLVQQTTNKQICLVKKLIHFTFDKNISKKTIKYLVLKKTIIKELKTYD